MLFYRRRWKWVRSNPLNEENVMNNSAMTDWVSRLSRDMLWSLALVTAIGLRTVAAGATAPASGPVFAKVGDTVITQREFDQTFERARRQRFYHFQPPEEQAAAFRREVADDLINRALLLQEADRRGLKPDAEGIQAQLDAYSQRYAKEPRWQQEGARLMASVKVYLEQEDRLKQLEQQVRQVAPPSEEQLGEFYAASPDKFTEPAQQRVSVILLQVDPSSPAEAWQAAQREGAQIVARLRDEGADFAELARLHSGDATAGNGGDMGYLHKGMLTETAEAELDKLGVGAVSDPMRVLEGIAIFRLEDRRRASLRDFSEVRERAAELWVRERGDSAWQNLQQGLRESTRIEILDPSLAPS